MSTKGRSWVIWTMIFCLGGGMASCAASQNESAEIQAPQAYGGNATSRRSDAPNQVSDSSPSEQGEPDQNSSVPTQAPQLIKTANLTLRVKDVAQSLDQIVGEILSQQQGDVLSLEDRQPQGDGDRHRASLQLRVPQGNLNATLKALDDLGTVERRSIQAQDVSNQIVDSTARLKNLRKSEEMVLQIMERSGSIPDVLSASQELSKIRENIERIDAQLQNLQARVAFSTINLQLEATTASIQPNSGVGLQLQETWKRSTSAVANLTMALIKLGVWGAAFSPYLIAIALLIWLGRYQFQKHKTTNSQNHLPPQPPSSESP